LLPHCRAPESAPEAERKLYITSTPLLKGAMGVGESATITTRENLSDEALLKKFAV
jgi:hypothetical protein